MPTSGESCANCYFHTTRTRLIDGVPTSYESCCRNAPNAVTTDVAETSKGLWPQIALTDWCGFWSQDNPIIYGKFNSVYDSTLVLPRGILQTTDATPQIIQTFNLFGITLDPFFGWCQVKSQTTYFVDPTHGGFQQLDFLIGQNVALNAAVLLGTGPLRQADNLGGVPAVQISVSGESFSLTVTGVAATTINWSTTFLIDQLL